MKPSPELFDLIRSLTKSEKRFFKLHSALQSGPKNYLRIFDAVDRQKAYDEEAIKQHFAKETFVKHFPSEKNHLYKLILKALRAYHAESSVSGLLKQDINNIEILFNKALYTEASKILQRAKRIAKINERFYHWFELLSWEKMLLEEAFQRGNFSHDVDALIKEEDEVLDKLRNLAAYHILYAKINYVFRSGGYVRTDEEHAIVEEISDHPLIKGKNTALSSRASTICHYTQGFCYWAKRDWETSYTKFVRAKTILDKDVLLRKDLPKRYVRTLHYVVQCEIELGKYEKAREHIDQLHDLRGSPGFDATDVEPLIEISECLSELRLLDRMGEYGAAAEVEGMVQQMMARVSEHIPKEYELELYHLLSTTQFGAGNMNRSLHWLNKVLNDPEPTLRQDIFTYARLFNLVVHYELGNYELLEYIVRSTQRFLSKRHRAYGVEAALIDHVKKLAKATSPEAKRTLFISLGDRLEELMKDPNEGTVLKYFNIRAWVASKVEGVGYSEAVRSNTVRK